MDPLVKKLLYPAANRKRSSPSEQSRGGTKQQQEKQQNKKPKKPPTSSKDDPAASAGTQEGRFDWYVQNVVLSQHPRDSDEKRRQKYMTQALDRRKTTSKGTTTAVDRLHPPTYNKHRHRQQRDQTRQAEFSKLKEAVKKMQHKRERDRKND